MALSGSIEDRLEIQELYARYTSASARGDRDGWLRCWAEDGAWVSHIFERFGKPEVAQQYDAIMDLFEKLYFASQTGPVEIDGETARASATAMEIGTYKNGGIFKLAGHYEDQLVRRNGEWLFLRRDYRPLVQDF